MFWFYYKRQKMHSNVKMSARICMFGSDDLDLFRAYAKDRLQYSRRKAGRKNLKSTPYAMRRRTTTPRMNWLNLIDFVSDFASDFAFGFAFVVRLCECPDETQKLWLECNSNVTWMLLGRQIVHESLEESMKGRIQK